MLLSDDLKVRVIDELVGQFLKSVLNQENHHILGLKALEALHHVLHVHEDTLQCLKKLRVGLVADRNADR